MLEKRQTRNLGGKKTEIQQTALSKAGVAVEGRQQLLGHRTAERNLHYTHAEISALRAAVESLPRISKTKNFFCSL
jgi:hypothetical protein